MLVVLRIILNEFGNLYLGDLKFPAVSNLDLCVYHYLFPYEDLDIYFVWLLRCSETIKRFKHNSFCTLFDYAYFIKKRSAYVS